MQTDLNEVLLGEKEYTSDQKQIHNNIGMSDNKLVAGDIKECDPVAIHRMPTAVKITAKLPTRFL